MARFFIDRPIFAWVIAIIIMAAGALAIRELPIEQYPNIAPTTVQINAVYPGASARALEESVTQVIEQAMTGIDHLLYLSSSSSSQGSASTSLTFEAGTDPDVAQVQVQNKLQQALRRLPQPVQAQGVTVTKSTNGYLIFAGFYSADGSMARADVGDYVASNLIDPISRVNGVGTVQMFGSGYAMRKRSMPRIRRSRPGSSAGCRPSPASSSTRSSRRRANSTRRSSSATSSCA